jgi:hypothetical protein
MSLERLASLGDEVCDDLRIDPVQRRTHLLRIKFKIEFQSVRRLFRFTEDEVIFATFRPSTSHFKQVR